MSERPFFSVICPTFNRGRALLRTLATVQRQSEGSFELIVASDGSTDDTDDVVRALAAEDPRVRLLRCARHGGPSGPTNLALARARGRAIAYIDHDDRWHPHHLALLRELLVGGAELAATGSRTVTEDGRLRHRTGDVGLCWHPDLQLLGPLLHNSCVAHVAGLAGDVGGWREDGEGLEDWDLWLRMADRGVRVATDREATVEIVSTRGSRQHSLDLRHAHVVATFDHWRAARQAQRTIARPEVQRALVDAAARDLGDHYVELARRGELVLPRGWRPTPEELGEAVVAHTVDRAEELPDPVLRRTASRYELVVPLSVMTAEHAARFSRLYRATMRRELAMLDRLLPDGSLVGADTARLAASGRGAAL